MLTTPTPVVVEVEVEVAEEAHLVVVADLRQVELLQVEQKPLRPHCLPM